MPLSFSFTRPLATPSEHLLSGTTSKRFTPLDVVGRGKDSGDAARGERFQGAAEHRVGGDCALRSESNSLEDGDHAVGDGAADNGGLPVLGGPAGGDGRVPGHRVLSHVLLALLAPVKVLLDLEARLLEGSNDVLLSDEVGEGVSGLDASLHAHVLGVLGVVLVSHHPVVNNEDTTGLEALEDFREALHSVGCVASGLDGISTIVTTGSKLLSEFHEVAVHTGCQVI
mmetsp:Transcript_5945/g.11804  ORF Transcript_5945/g.11804 Transcript_5945/m.11804 type:complete len:227 (+) Transcript_5945:786-1466(+)